MYLTSYQENLICLLRLIPIQPICENILYYKSEKENSETLNYYTERWENIAGEYFHLIDNHTGKFSFIHDSTNYIIKDDYRLTFYQITGISYQIICLLHELIKLKNEKFITQDEGYEYWLKYDDNLYSLLSKKIMDSMRYQDLLQ